MYEPGSLRTNSAGFIRISSTRDSDGKQNDDSKKRHKMHARHHVQILKSIVPERTDSPTPQDDRPSTARPTNQPDKTKTTNHQTLKPNQENKQADRHQVSDF